MKTKTTMTTLVKETMLMGTIATMSFPTRPLWRGKIIFLLNENSIVHGKAIIWVCLLKEPYDEDILEDTNVGIVFIFENNNNLQMTIMLSHTKSRSPTTHLISVVFMNVAVANLIFAGIVVDLDENYED